MSCRLEQIVMDFPGTRALDGVSAEFRFDEVHGLIGENGAGKSTFVNVLGGSLRPTSGQLNLEDRPVTLDSPRAALAHGIAHVSQEGSLVPGLTGAENILLGAEPRRAGGVLRSRELNRRAAELVENWFPSLALPLDRPVGELPMAEQKVIEIVRALRGNIRLLILDEPTATLEAREKRRLWSIIRGLPQRGVGVVLISHFLSEVRDLSDRITVLRDGKHVATLQAKDATEAQLVDLMLRREGALGPAIVAETRSRSVGAPVLRVRDWTVGGVTVPEFTLQAGQIVGLIGLTGAGHFGFARSLYTRQGVSSGRIEVAGRSVEARGVRAMQQSGVALVPDHRMENALSGEGSVLENLSMVHADTAARSGILSRRAEHAEAGRIIRLLNIKTPGDGQLIRNLSGGNKQKVSIGKWLYGAGDRYRVLIFIEPTEGVDIGAKQEIYAHIRRLAAGGAGIVIASSDLIEIAQVCDIALPFAHGRLGTPIPASEFSEARFIAAISGEAA
ncbi:Ribose ABC transport system, ATP-binding protein RbsA [Rubellimicrobium mesophilum DSM 19309]|uniref:Ribose ABC transport system, ATP-binding protein RbsA n=1 Tax=Rubellimicrobium mesophilum DSM 19309 TaxID=442562 RepID=A0A017HM52_9RHOB|nr:sugar ABC transporter ATP-binding protein [Rubellimicrobium mesophilum]EYD75537.1 Ribose ABC transport system, ATP-binding protein RbsA [Rubellimicrobium mesophilum DSM 19309]